MRKFILPVAATAALVLLAADATPAQAQIVSTSGYSPGYSGGYYPYYTGSGIVIGNGGLGFNASPLYGGYGSGYGGYSNYGYQPNYGGSYYGNYGYGSRSYYGGNRYYGGGRRYR